MLAGCTAPRPDPVLGEPNTYWQVVVETAFKQGIGSKPEHRAMALPNGTPAESLEMLVEVVANPTGAVWPGDQPCPIESRPDQYVAVCPPAIERQRMWIIPSASQTTDDTGRTFVKFPLTPAGRLTLLVPREIVVGFGEMGRLSDALHAQTADPSGCQEAEGRAFLPEAWTAEGDIRVQLDGARISGPGRITVPWTTTCVRR